jgi:hypothetical protein
VVGETPALVATSAIVTRTEAVLRLFVTLDYLPAKAL